MTQSFKPTNLQKIKEITYVYLNYHLRYFIFSDSKGN